LFSKITTITRRKMTMTQNRAFIAVLSLMLFVLVSTLVPTTALAEEIGQAETPIEIPEFAPEYGLLGEQEIIIIAPPDETPLEKIPNGSESAIPTQNNAFTPDGSGTTVDHATGSDGKEFYTIMTPEENVFYLVIDRQRDNLNVYFLNAVTEADLIALAKVEIEPSGTKDGAIPTPTIENPDVSATPDEPNSEENNTEPSQPEQKSNSKMIILVIVVVLGAGGAGYYFKIVRKKNPASDDDDYDDPEDDDEELVSEEDKEEDDALIADVDLMSDDLEEYTDETYSDEFETDFEDDSEFTNGD
jgi:hypothetical protein